MGRDFGKIEAAINYRNGIITDADVAGMCREAKEILGRGLGGEKNASL